MSRTSFEAKLLGFQSDVEAVNSLLCPQLERLRGRSEPRDQICLKRGLKVIS